MTPPQTNLPTLSVKDTKGVKRKLNGLSLEKMKTKPFCSLTFLYLPVKIVSNVESSKERTRPKESSDSVGNMVTRKGDSYNYNAQNKLTRVNTSGGDVFQYLYEASGNRIKKQVKNSGMVVYSFGGLYEITKTPGQPDKHTLYFKGLYGDVFSQMTRNDAQLQREDSAMNLQDEFNRIKYAIQRVALSITTTLNSTVGIVTLLLLTILVGYGMLTLNGSINIHTVLTPIMLVGFLFTNINCGNFTSKKKGEAPWLLLVSGINQKTESIDQPQGGGSSGGGGASPLVPPTGMFFLHPDHLGSVSMITDGFGNVITGGNNGGKSSINYKPYGEINRTDSSEPDITKFKYTGQEEDKESGLLYYKARYYDPAIGRFLQADSIVMPENLYGMNRYMYVDGNPVKYVDPSGNKAGKDLYSKYIKKRTEPEQRRAGDDHWQKIAKNMKGGIDWAGEGIRARDIRGGIDWASKGVRNSGLKQAADTFHRATGQDYERRIRKSIHYDRCAVGLFNPVALSNCLFATSLYEFGARGGEEKMDEAMEGTGLGIDVADSFNLLEEGSPLGGLAHPGVGIAMFIMGRIVKSGARIHNRNQNHRAKVNLLGCFHLGRSITDDDTQDLFQLSCAVRYGSELAK
jgi:RHS repeat-associated protein